MCQSGQKANGQSMLCMYVSDLQWSRRIEHFYKSLQTSRPYVQELLQPYTHPEIIRDIYISIFHTHLEHARAVWDPCQLKDIRILENIACKVCSKTWCASCDYVLPNLSLETLESQRSVPKLVLMYCIFVRNSHPLIFTRYCNLTSHYFVQHLLLFIFVPKIPRWKTLPNTPVNAPSP